MITLLILAILSDGYEVEIRNPGEGIFACRTGEVVPEISPSIFEELEWEETSRHGVIAGEDSLYISVFTNAGNGAVVTVFRRFGSGYLFIGEFTSLFGGNGIEFVVSDPFISANGEVLFCLDWTAYLRGYYAVPDDEDSHVSPSELSSFFILATDGDSLWTVLDQR
ncbi:MAG: hypothetical protein KAH54_02235 [Candidatus Sabulitectum sp.]|nr:hypothetical protein [Candidatus Sabulitectum sp.]